MGHPGGGTDTEVLVLLDVVEVTSEVPVGRAGALKLLVLLSSGQTSRPQARSVGQHPPPSETGHDRNPDEHTKVFGACELEEGDCVVLVSFVVGVVTTTTVVVPDVGEGGGFVVDVEGSGVVLDVEGVGTMTTTVVETCTHPTPWQAYPGKQQPPPGF